jgi:hypothetical protein
MEAVSVQQQTDAEVAANVGTEGKRINVIFTPEQYEILQKLAKMQNISMSDALRQAIGISNLILQANADPNTQILIKEGDSVQQLRIVR